MLDCWSVPQTKSEVDTVLHVLTRMGKKRDREGSDVGHSSDGHSKKKREKEQKKRREDAPQPKSLPPHRYILAPMVGGSELAFRMLCRRYATRDLLCYTPMMNSVRFAVEKEYREEIFSTLPEDRPLVGHFCGNDPKTLLELVQRLSPARMHGVELDLLCNSSGNRVPYPMVM